MLQNTPEVERENCSVVFKKTAQKFGVESVGCGRRNPSWFVDISFNFVKTTLPLFSSSAFLSTSLGPEFLNF